jgi:hypothetical protein
MSSNELHHRHAPRAPPAKTTQEVESKDEEYSPTRKRLKRWQWGRLVGITSVVGLVTAVAIIKSAKDKQQFLQDGEFPLEICILDPDRMPPLWRPPSTLSFQDQGKPWSFAEQSLANEAVEKALEELTSFYEHNITTSRIKELSTDAVNSLIDEAYGSQSRPVAHKMALEAASRNLKLVANKYTTDNPKYQGCKGTYRKLKYVGYGQYLVNNLPYDTELHQLQKTLVKVVNDMFHSCGSLEEVLDLGNLKKIFRNKKQDADEVVYDWVMKAIALTDCLTVPGLHMPKGTDEFIANVWDYLQQYKLTNAREHPKGYANRKTRLYAWLATHIAYLPTGYGRHKQYIEDAPFLYRYIRENFYPAMEYGMLDLVCEFIDLVRQYGCSEEDDYQVRHGSRYILSLYEKAGHSWMNYREKREQKPGYEVEDYDLIHKPWTATSGVGRRDFEPVVPGSYGYAFQKVLERTGKAKSTPKQRKVRR